MPNKPVILVKITLKNRFVQDFLCKKKIQGVKIITKKNVDTNGHLYSSSNFQNIKTIYYQTCLSVMFFPEIFTLKILISTYVKDFSIKNFKWQIFPRFGKEKSQIMGFFYNRYVRVRSKEHNKDAYNFVISYMVYSQKLARIFFGWSLFWLHQKIAKEKSAVAYGLKVELFNNIVWKIYEWSWHIVRL